MSNLTLFNNGSSVPDYLRNPEDDVTKSLAGQSSTKAISIKGGVWRLMSGGEEIAKNEDRALNMVIVAAAKTNSRTYFQGKYEEGKDIGPTCWSADGVKPNDEVPADQRQSSLCVSCPQNIEGSGEGKSRACRFSRRLAVVLDNDIGGDIYRLQLPAKSIFGKPVDGKMSLQAYANFLSGHNVPINGLVTEARFDTGEAVPVLRFKAVRPLTREEWEVAKAQGASEDARRAIEFKLAVKTDKQAALPAAFAETPARKEVVAAEPAVEEVAEPVKRAKKAAPAAEPTDKPSVAAILSDWGSDDDE
jgi:hypothetical protein